MNMSLADRKTRNIIEEIKLYFKGDLRINEDMSSHTTLRIGGPADIYAVPEDVSSLKSLLLYLFKKGIPLTFLGGGSNVLISDSGIEGVVISSLSFNRAEIIELTEEAVRLFIESGMSMQSLLNLSKEKGFAGLEGLAGIPGSVGGAIKGNAGSFGIEIGDVIESIAVMDLRHNISIINKNEIGFRYRGSKVSEGFILSAIIRLRRDNPDEVRKRINFFLAQKKARQPLSLWSAGCVFKNPEGATAAKLIDEAGCKGMSRGDIAVSEKHANFFINKRRGTASDFLSLMDDVRNRVFKYYGIELEPEIRIIGRGC